MKMSLRSLFIAGLVSLTAVCVQAAEVLSEAVVLKLTGPAEAVFPGQTQPVSLKVGDKLPQGTTITTSSTSEVDVQVFPGTTATIKAGSKVDIEKLALSSSNGVVTKQSSVINLKVGSVVSDLDPAKKSINDYSIRTPKGVAAARGTIYVVYVFSDGSTVTYVARGSVTFVNPTTGKSVTVNAGFAVKVDASGNIGSPDSSLGRELSAELRNGNRIKDVNAENTESVDTTIIVSPAQ